MSETSACGKTEVQCTWCMLQRGREVRGVREAVVHESGGERRMRSVSKRGEGA